MMRTARLRFVLRVTLGYALLATLWIVLSDRLIEDLADAAWLGTIKGLGFVLVTAALLYLALRAVPELKPESLPVVRAHPWGLLAVLLLFAVGIAVIGFFAYRSQYDTVRRAQYDQLRAVAELKAAGVTRFLDERRENARRLSENTTVRSVLSRWLRDGRDEDRELLRYVMRARHTIFDDFSRVEMLDLSGRRLLGDHPELTACELRNDAVKRAVDTGEVVFLDLHRHEPDGIVHMGYVVPVMETGDHGIGVQAVFFLEMSPETFLYPFLQSWPLPNATGETLLIRRDGDEVVFLNELRHRADAALRLRLPLASPDLPAAKALRDERATEGVDHRGARVLAAAQRVAGTPWFLIAKMDEDEAMKGLRRLARLTGLLALGAVALAAALVGFLWQRHHTRAVLRELSGLQVLKAADERLRVQGAALEAVANAVVITNHDAVIEWANPAFTRLTGYALDEAIGRKPRDLIKSGVQSREFYERLWQTIIYGRVWRGELVNRRKDGTLYHEEMTVTPIPDENGAIRRFVAVKQDITERKQTETQTEAAQSLLRATLEATADGILVVDRGGRIVSYNRRFTELWRIPDAVLETRNDDAALNYVFDQLAEPEAFLQKVRQWYSEPEAEGEDMIYLRDGRVFERATRPQLLDGDVVGRVWSFRDVTGREQVMRDLRDSEEKYRMLFSRERDAVFVADAETLRILDANPAMTAMYGYTRDELLTLRAPDLSAEPERTRVSIAQLLRNGYVEIDARRHRRKDGTEFVVQGSAVTFTWKGRRVITGIFRDTTERAEAEEELRRSEEKFRSYIENAPTAVFIASPEGRYLESNPAGLQMLGYDAATLATLYGTDVIAKDDHPRAMRAYLTLRRTGFVEGEFRHRRADGGVIWVAMRAVRLDDGCFLAFCRDVTGQKQAQDALRESELRFRATIESVRDALVVIRGGDGIVNEWNSGAQAMFGYRRDEIIGRRMHDSLVPERYREAARHGLKAFAASGEGPAVGQTLELEALRRDGEEFPIELSVSPMKLGGEWYAVGIARDITQRREATQALRASETLLERVQTMAQLGSWTADVAAQTFTGSPEAIRIAGLSKATVHWDEFWAVVHPDDIVRIRASFQKVLAGEPQEEEFRIVVSGRVVWLHSKSTAVFDAQGRPLQVVGMIQDITEMHEARQALEAHKEHLEELVAARTDDLLASEAHSRLILESSAAGLYGIGSDGRITFVNPAACAMLGYHAEQMVGEPVHEKIHHSRPDGTAYPAEECPMLIALRDGRTFTTDREVFWRTDGSALAVEYAIRPMVRYGEIVGGVVSFTDIGARKAMEAAQEKARIEAERLARVRSEFLANMSHEIRTPLSAILGLAQVGMRDSAGRKVYDNFARILNSGELLLGLVNDVLDVARMEAGKLAVERVAMELSKAMDVAVDVIAPRAYGKGLEFHLEEAADLPLECMGDSLRLSQVLLNLLSNAVKFTNSGHVGLSARREGGELVFRVTDTGIGMTEEQLQRLFQPFEQVDSSTTRLFGGTGLGLAISKRLVELMSGKIVAESRLGEGSTFEVRLPLVETGIFSVSRSSGTVVLAGLPESEGAATVSAVRAMGVQTVVTTPAAAFTTPADLVVLGCESLWDSHMVSAAETAIRSGCKLVLVCTPGLDERMLRTIRDFVHIVERPLRARHLLRALNAPVPAAPSASQRRRLEGGRVLVAEDNELNRVVIEEMLKGEGAQVVLAENGRQAVECVRHSGADSFDVVLTDVQMPEMDGYEATRLIRELAPALPVIGVTAHAMPEERDRCLAAGMADRLVKPVDVDLLVGAIRRYARGRFSETAPPAVATEPEAQHSAPTERSAMIDWAGLEAHYRDRPHMIGKLVEVALRGEGEKAAKLRAAAAQGDLEALAFLAHGLKGVGGNLKATAFRELAAQTEAAARAGKPEAATLAGQLAAATEVLLAELAIHNTRLKSGGQ